MRNFFRGLLAVITGVIVIILLFGIANLLVNLVVYLILQIPVIGKWFARFWWDACFELLAAYIAYFLGAFIVTKIAGNHTKTQKTSLIITASIMIAIHVIGILSIIVALLLKIDYDNTLFANIANIIGGLLLISEARKL